MAYGGSIIARLLAICSVCKHWFKRQRDVLVMEEPLDDECQDVCPNRCPVCMVPMDWKYLDLILLHLRNQHLSTKPRRPGEYPPESEGEFAYRNSIKPCCTAYALGRRAEQENLRELFIEFGSSLEDATAEDKQREKITALPDDLMYADILLNWGATVDRAWLDGLGAHFETGTYEFGLFSSNVGVQVYPPKKQAEYQENGQTFVNLDFDIIGDFKLIGSKYRVQKRMAGTTKIPATKGSYFTFVDKGCGGIKYIQLRSSRLPGEVEARMENKHTSVSKVTSHLLGKNKSASYTTIIHVHWNEYGRIASITLPCTVKSYEVGSDILSNNLVRKQISLEGALYALFGIPIEEEEDEEVLDLFQDILFEVSRKTLDDGKLQNATFAQYAFAERMQRETLKEEQEIIFNLLIKKIDPSRASVILGKERRDLLIKNVKGMIHGCSDGLSDWLGRDMHMAVRVEKALRDFARCFVAACRVYMDPNGEHPEKARSSLYPGQVAGRVLQQGLADEVRGVMHTLLRSKKKVTSKKPKLKIMKVRSARKISKNAAIVRAENNTSICPFCRVDIEEKCDVCSSQLLLRQKFGIETSKKTKKIRPSTSYYWNSNKENDLNRLTHNYEYFKRGTTAGGMLEVFKKKERKVIKSFRDSISAKQKCKKLREKILKKLKELFPEMKKLKRSLGESDGSLKCVSSKVWSAVSKRFELVVTEIMLSVYSTIQNNLFQAVHKALRSTKTPDKKPYIRLVTDKEDGTWHQASVCKSGTRVTEADTHASRRNPHPETRLQRCLMYFDEKNTDEKRMACNGQHWMPALGNEISICSECAEEAIMILKFGLMVIANQEAKDEIRRYAEKNGLQNSTCAIPLYASTPTAVETLPSWEIDFDDDIQKLYEAMQEKQALSSNKMKDDYYWSSVRIGQESLVYHLQNSTGKNVRRKIRWIRSEKDTQLGYAEGIALQRMYVSRIRRRARQNEWKVGDEVYLPTNTIAYVTDKITFEAITCDGELKTFTTSEFTHGCRHPRIGDSVDFTCNFTGQEMIITKILQVELSTSLEISQWMDPHDLRRAPPRGDPGKLPNEAYSVPILDIQHGAIDIPTQGGHLLACVRQTIGENIAEVDQRPRRTGYSDYWEAYKRGFLSFWPSASSDEEVDTLRDLENNDSLNCFKMLGGERSVRCRRSELRQPPVGHPVRAAAGFRTLSSSAQMPVGFGLDRWDRVETGPQLLSSLMSPGCLFAVGTKPFKLSYIAMQDEAGSNGCFHEDAGCTFLNSHKGLGECIVIVVEQRITPGRILTYDDLRNDKFNISEDKIKHLGKDGCAIGPVRQNEPLCYVQSKSGEAIPEKCKFSCVAHRWSRTLKNELVVTLLTTEEWCSGWKETLSHQKSVITEIVDMFFAAVPISWVRFEGSCISRNTACIWIASLMMDTCHALGFAAHRLSCIRMWPSFSELFDGQKPCKLDDLYAARQLIPGINVYSMYPTTRYLDGKFGGYAFICPQAQAIAPKNDALHKFESHLGPGSQSLRKNQPSKAARIQKNSRAMNNPRGQYNPNRDPEHTTPHADFYQVERRRQIYQRLHLNLIPRNEMNFVD